jgi:aminomethyltransferase
MTPGYAALRESAAWFDLSARGRIRAAGEDRKRLLHAMTTNHVEQLAPGQGLYAFFLNAQGRVLADVILLCRDDDLLLSVEPEVREKIYRHLDKFIIADDVTLEDVTEATSEIALEGPGSGEALRAAGAAPPDAPYSFTRWGDRMVVKASATGAEGYRVIGPRGDTAWLAGIAEATAEDVLAARLEHGAPRYGDDITEAHIAHETRQLHALHFNKGCYLGQEIVERVRSRGHVNRLLLPLRIEGDAPPARGTKIMAGGKEAGEITSAAFSPAERCVRALGYVRAEHRAAELSAGGAPARVIQSS